MMDLKPANVLLSGELAADGSVAGEDRAVLTDFGPARRLSTDMSRIMVWGEARPDFAGRAAT
jgi:serine/threonine protein kinase